MANDFTALDKWRAYFRTSDSDIFSIIEYAIMVAASDCPYEFRLKRDRIAELLFSHNSKKCYRCEKIQSDFPRSDGDSNRSEEKCKSAIATKNSKMSSFSTDDKVMMVNNKISRGEAEALTDELEEEYQFRGEVLRIKQIIDNYREESDSSLFDSLRKLQLMPMNVEILKSTEIGKSVNAVRKHGLKEIRSLSRALIESWKVMVDSWVGSAAATESVKKRAEEDEEGALFAAPVSMELSQFFDGMDDDGRRKGNHHHHHQLKGVDDHKLEAAKRKLHERYKEAENAKKRRRIQVVEDHLPSVVQTKRRRILHA